MSILGLERSESMDLKTSINQIYQLYYPVLKGYGRKISKNEELIDDTIQDLFLYILDKGINLNKVANTKAYLLLSFRRLLLLELKKHRRVRSMIEELGVESDQQKKEAYLPNADAEQDKIKVIERFMKSLSPRRRELVTLRYFEGLDNQEIAEHLDLRYQTVLNHFYAAFKNSINLSQISERPSTS